VRYPADDPGGSLKVSGRYNLGLDLTSSEQAFSALYLGLTQATCVGEVLRHLTPATFAQLTNYRLTELRVDVSAVIDCRDPSVLGLTVDAVCDEFDYSLPRQLARAAVAVGVEGLLVPSATRLGSNLVLFPSTRREGSSLTVVQSIDPRIYVNRDPTG
jgi:hypothetical protein